MHLALVLERLCGLTCSLEKCYFGETKLEFLGHIVTSEHNEAKPKQIRPVFEASLPRNLKHLEKYLGIYGGLREYVPNFARVAAPVTSLLAKKRTWNWTPEVDTAFNETKALFAQPIFIVFTRLYA